MGHRANFVIIRDGRASAYYDQWGALGCAFLLADGPEQAATAAEHMEPTAELLDWGFAEGGFLLDFDQKKLIAFGYPEPLDLEDIGDLEDVEGLGDTHLTTAFDGGADGYLRQIAPRWLGWLLVWDDRGVDSFAEHLSSRSIGDVKTQPPSHPPDREIFRLQA